MMDEFKTISQLLFQLAPWTPRKQVHCETETNLFWSSTCCLLGREERDLHILLLLHVYHSVCWGSILSFSRLKNTGILKRSRTLPMLKVSMYWWQGWSWAVTQTCALPLISIWVQSPGEHWVPQWRSHLDQLVWPWLLHGSSGCRFMQSYLCHHEDWERLRQHASADCILHLHPGHQCSGNEPHSYLYARIIFPSQGRKAVMDVACIWV